MKKTVVYSKLSPGLTAIRLGEVDHNGMFVAELDEEFFGEYPPEGVNFPYMTVLLADEWSDAEIVESPLPEVMYLLVQGVPNSTSKLTVTAHFTEEEAREAASRTPESPLWITVPFGIVPVAVQRNMIPV